MFSFPVQFSSGSLKGFFVRIMQLLHLALILFVVSQVRGQQLGDDFKIETPPVNNFGAIDLKINQPADFRFIGGDPNFFPQKLDVDIEPKKAADYSKLGQGIIRITPKTPFVSATITFSLPDRSWTKEYKLRILENLGDVRVADGKAIELTQGSNEIKQIQDFLTFFPSSGSEPYLPGLSLPNLRCEVIDSEVAKVDKCTTLMAGARAKKTQLVIYHPNFSSPKYFQVTVRPKAKTLRLFIATGNALLEPKTPSIVISSEVRDLNGELILDGVPIVDWTVLEGSGLDDVGRKVNLARRDNSSATVSLLSNAITDDAQFSGPVRVRGCLEGILLRPSESNTPVGCSDIQIDTRKKSVSGFRPLRIRLDILDDLTAKDLFGNRASKEYFIAKVRLFNEIGAADADFGKSILVYSESLEVRVGVEYREIRNDQKPKKGAWKPLWGSDNSRSNGIRERAVEGQVQMSEPSQFENPWFTQELTENDNKHKKCKVIRQPGMFVPYRPLTFEMVLNTQDRRDARSVKSKILLIASGASSATSFITSIAVPGAGSDLPVAIEKFNNLLIPSFQKLFPSLNEVQRQNITSMVMRPLEEIPFGSDITRILFFPKKPFSGVLLNRPGVKRTELRISAISISDACAEVGLIQKASDAVIQ